MEAPSSSQFNADSCKQPIASSQVAHVVQLILLAVAIWAAIYARSALGAMQEVMRINLSLSDHEVALLQGTAPAIPMVLGAIPLGLIVDRYCRVRLLLLFAIVSLAATALSALTSSLTVLFGARCAIGLAMAATLIAAYSLVADLSTAKQRGRTTMILALGEITGSAAAFALGGMLLGLVGPTVASPSQGWRSALLWMCVPLGVATLLMLALREPARSGIVVQRPPLSMVWSELWRYRAVMAPLLLARSMVWIGEGALLVWAAPNFTRSFSLSAGQAGSIMGTVLLIAGLVGPALGGLLADFCQIRGGPRRTVAALAVLALVSVPTSLFSIAHNVTLASSALTVFLTLGYIFGTAALTVGTIVIPGELRGLYLAVTNMVAALFMGIAPLMVSFLSGVLGGPAMIGKALLVVCGGTSVVGAAVFASTQRHFPCSA